MEVIMNLSSKRMNELLVEGADIAKEEQKRRRKYKKQFK